jgi:sugar lactone lactonase YvrE
MEGDGSLVTLGVIEPDDRLQLNDAACDNRGRLWVGTFGRKGESEVGSLFKVDVDGTVTKELERISISNGIGWSPDGSRMYYVDSVTGQIDVFDYDVEQGLAIGRRRFVSLVDGPGLPDGLAVDANGGVWVAIWDSAAVLRLSADGVLTHRVDLPVARPTACCFGGEDLRTLFITSAWAELPREERLAQPFAGSIFCCENLPFEGLPTSPYAGPIAAGSLMPPTNRVGLGS